MKYHIEADMHTHTIKSHNGHSTLLENVEAAIQRNLSAIAVTDYGPEYNNGNTKRDLLSQSLYIPDKINGVKIYKGIEINIMDIHTGKLDITEDEALQFDWTIASYNKKSEYDSRFMNAAIIERTLAGVIKNPTIMMVGHPERFKTTFNIESFVELCKNYGKVVELNVLFIHEEECYKSAKMIMEECKKQQCPICINSDAHIATQIGEFSKAFELLSSIGFPAELIVNNSMVNLQSYIESFQKLRNSRIAKQNLPRQLERFKPINSK